jgi:peptide methionine sulfoxide reductase MsrA
VYTVQGNDRGTQYRSGIYYYDDEQKALALSSKEAFQVRKLPEYSLRLCRVYPKL